MTKNILVIDDEKLVAKSIQKLLHEKGYNVVVAEDGLTALEKVKETDFDLIISDIRMGGMDGIETMKNIRGYLSQKGKKSIPEVVITGYADEDSYIAATKLEVADYVYKPFDNEVFLKIIQSNITE